MYILGVVKLYITTVSEIEDVVLEAALISVAQDMSFPIVATNKFNGG